MREARVGAADLRAVDPRTAVLCLERATSIGRATGHGGRRSLGIATPSRGGYEDGLRHVRIVLRGLGRVYLSRPEKTRKLREVPAGRGSVSGEAFDQGRARGERDRSGPQPGAGE